MPSYKKDELASCLLRRGQAEGASTLVNDEGINKVRRSESYIGEDSNLEEINLHSDQSRTHR